MDMDIQDHEKTTHVPSGHEGHGVHLCHRCGWPFPNPHPSARHRRAHKKICGTIEGYTKLVDSEVVSDDEHHSDQEKQETPSPDAGKKSSIKESGSGAAVNGERSSRSEDDLFSDAVAEFSDSGISPGVEERFVGKGDLDKTLERDSFHSFKDAVTDVTDLESSPMEITKVDDVAVSETLVTEMVEDTHAKDVVKSEEREASTECASAEGKMKLLETDEGTSDPLIKDGTPGDSDGSQKVQSIDHLEAAASAVLTKADFAMDADMIGVSDKKEPREETVNFLSVASDMPIVDQSEASLEDSEGRAMTSNVPRVEGFGADKDTVEKIISSAEASSMVLASEEKTGGEKIKDFQASENDESQTNFSASTPTLPTEEAEVAENQPLELSNINPGFLDSVVEGGKQEELIEKPSDVAATEKTEALSSGEIREDIWEEKLESYDEGTPEIVKEPEIDHNIPVLTEKEVAVAPKLEKCSEEYTKEVVKEAEIDHSLPVVTEKEVASAPAPNLEKCSEEYTEEVVTIAKKTDNDNKVLVESVKADKEDSVDVVLLEKSSDKIINREAEKLAKESEHASKNSATMENIHGINNGKNASVVGEVPMVEESNGKLMTNQDSAVDVSVDSSSHNSLEGNWGSVSVLSAASVDAETMPSNGKSNTNLEKSGIAEDGCDSNKSDAFEAPSFMTLVEPKGEAVDKQAASVSTEIEAEHNSKQQPKSASTVANESEERKRNEEVIAKVTNWSTGKHSTPLKNLLGEAKSSNPKQLSTVVQKDESEEKSNGNAAATEKPLLTSEAAMANQEMSPPKFIGEGKKDQKKVKRRASWIPFVCCSSINVN